MLPTNPSNATQGLPVPGLAGRPKAVKDQAGEDRPRFADALDGQMKQAAADHKETDTRQDRTSRPAKADGGGEKTASAPAKGDVEPGDGTHVPPGSKEAATEETDGSEGGKVLPLLWSPEAATADPQQPVTVEIGIMGDGGGEPQETVATDSVSEPGPVMVAMDAQVLEPGFAPDEGKAGSVPHGAGIDSTVPLPGARDAAAPAGFSIFGNLISPGKSGEPQGTAPDGEPDQDTAMAPAPTLPQAKGAVGLELAAAKAQGRSAELLAEQGGAAAGKKMPMDLQSSPGGATPVSGLHPAPGAAPTPAALPPVLTLAVPVRQAGWDQALGERVLWMAKGGVQEATVQLHPRHLGPIEVRISVHQDQASVAFTAHNPVTRDALEAALPRLREMMGDNGLSLVQSEVSQQSPEQQRQAFGEQGADHRGVPGAQAQSIDGPEADTAEGSAVVLGSVDYFA